MNLTDLVSNDDPETRKLAIELVGRLGKEANDLIPDLVHLSVADRDRRVNYAAFTALERIGAPPDVLVPLYIDKLTSLPKDEPDDPHGFARSLAAWTLGRLSPEGAAGIPALIACVTDRSDHGDPRYASGWALERLGPHAKDYLKEITRVVADDPDPSVRAVCASALGAMGPHAERAIPVLIDVLNEQNPLIREEAARSLGRIGRSPERSVSALINAASDSDPLVREHAVESLGAFPSKAAESVLVLVDALRADTQAVRRKAALALRALGEVAVPAVEALLTASESDESSSVRSAAAAALEIVEPGSSKRIARPEDSSEYAQLVERLDSEDGRVRAGTTWNLALWGPRVDHLVQTFSSRLKRDDHSDARWAAAWALGRMRSADDDAIRGLQSAVLTDEDPDNRAEAARALGWIGPDAAMATPTLTEALSDVYSLVREEAATALGRIGDLTSVQALRTACADSHESVRRRAVQALQQLEGDG